MSTPFPLEEQTQLERPQAWDPWKAPVTPRWYAGLGASEDNAYLGPYFYALQGAGQGAAKGEQLLAGTWHALAEGMASFGEAIHAPAAGMLRQIERGAADVQADAKARVAALTPDPQTVGTAGQLVSGLASAAYRVGVGSVAGGPVAGAALLGGSEATSQYGELREEGVGPGAAAVTAGARGLTAAGGALLPVGYGSTLLTRLMTGAAGNTALGVLSRYTDHAILDAAGYKEMAAQQRPWDGTQLLTDGVLGAGFGVLSHLQSAPRGTPLRDVPGAEDAALTTNLALQARRSAPGVAVDPEAAAAHERALGLATEQVLSGQPVNVAGSGVEAATFARRPELQAAEPVRQALFTSLRDAGVLGEQAKLEDLEAQLAHRLGGPAPPPRAAVAPPTVAFTAADIPRNPRLSVEDRGMETRFAQNIAGDYEGMKARYAALPDTEGGRIMSVDTARELSPDYLADRTRSQAVHEPASFFIKRLFAEKLAEAPGPGQEPLVLFTGGGTGAGKSTAVKETLGASSNAQIVYDTNLDGAKSAIGKIDQSLAANKQVEVAYVYRDPIEALTGGALKRAMRQEADFGSGRTVPLASHIGTHVNSNETVRELAAHYERNPNVKIEVIDNSAGRGNAHVIPLAEMPRLDYNRVREKATATLEAAFAQGRISRAVYRGFAGAEPAQPLPGESGRPAGGAASELRAAPSEQSQLERPERRPDELAHSVVTAAGRRVDVAPKLVELNDLVTSDRAEYPSELQPRRRGARAALTEQVRDMARNLNPELLGNAPEADRGAPITGPENVVESGNGRVFALREAYANHPEKAQAYREWLESQGHDLAGMKQPMLVRERVTPLDLAERRAFTVEANQTSVAALSPVERAGADARLLDAGALSQMRPGEFSSVQNASFVRAFLERLPQSERNALVNPDGTVSQEGVRRLQAAVLAKAYGGARESNHVLGRMLESTDSDMRSTMGALLDAAPAFARLRQAIEEGKVGQQYDIARALTQAVETTGKVRESGQALGEFLKQGDFLTRRLPVVDQLMRSLYDKTGERLAGREKVAQALMNYADRALKQRLDQGMLFGDAPLPPERLLAPTELAPGGGEGMRPATDMFGLRTPQGKTAEPAMNVAQSVLKQKPNLEIPTERDGETARGRSELLGATEDVQRAEERAPDAFSTAADCAGQRPEAA